MIGTTNSIKLVACSLCSGFRRARNPKSLHDFGKVRFGALSIAGILKGVYGPYGVRIARAKSAVLHVGRDRGP